jgi:phage terminase large subunit-like protein
MIEEDAYNPDALLDRYGEGAILREYAARMARRDAILKRIHTKFPPENSAKQVAFHADKSRVRSLRGCNQAGKTKAGAREAAYRMLGVHPDYAVPRPPIHGRVVTYSFKQSRVVQRALFDMVPLEEINPVCLPNCDPSQLEEMIRVGGFKKSTLILRNGSTCEVYTAWQGTLAHSGDTLDFVWCDEPPKETHYSELAARLLARRGVMWLTYTPIGRPVEWLKKQVEDKKISDHLVRLTVEDCPFYTQELIDGICAVYLPSEYEQRVNGAWDGITTGRVFGAFNPKKHVFTEPPDFDYLLVLGGDHGEKAGSEVIFLLGVVETGDGFELYVLAEYVSPGNTKPEDDARGVLAMLARFGWDLFEVRYMRGDVNTGGKLGDGYSINALLEREFATLARSKNPPFKIMIPDKSKGSIVGGCKKINFGFAEDRIYVHESCTTLIKTLRHWTGLNDDLKHAADAFRYVAVDFLNHNPLDAASEAVIMR